MSTKANDDLDLTARYLEENAIKKLQIGCGPNLLQGWLNSDYLPKSRDVIHLDAKGSYPFEEGTFDYIFCEHVIEHVPFGKGVMMLTETLRILKSGGKVRISTPDLAFLMNIMSHSDTNIHKRYIKWATDTFISGVPSYQPAFVLNNFVRAWGHEFIYDEPTLRAAFTCAGFREIQRFPISISDDVDLCNLENEKRMPDGFLALESMILEGTK